MDIAEKTCMAMEKNEFYQFMRGDDEYKVGISQYVPAIEGMDIDKVLVKGIYTVYCQQKEVKSRYENTLLDMLGKSNHDIYLVCSYLTSQFFMEKKGISPFCIEKSKILDKLKAEVKKRKCEIQEGVRFPSGYTYNSAWSDLERFNMIFKKEYGIELF